MKRVAFITIAYFCAHVFCQEFQELEQPQNDKNRPSMLGSLTDGSVGGVWLNATERPITGVCETEETYVEEVKIVDRVPFQVEVEVWCWSIRCTEWETRYREEARYENVTKTRKIPQCCDGFELVLETGECRPVCAISCENYGACVRPNTCKCEYGYEGQYCEIDALPEGVLSGPNVCEREEMREEVVRVMEQELVETTIKEWCWPKIRCQKTKMEPMSVEKLQKMIKPHRVRYCCDGFAQNFIGNRCIAVQYVDDSQQQINQQ